jgi:hypothetical protein
MCEYWQGLEYVHAPNIHFFDRKDIMALLGTYVNSVTVVKARSQ